MKQTTQRIVCLLIGIVLICSFAGCNDPVNPVVTQPNTEPSTTVGSVENQTTAPNATDATTVPLETEPTPTEQTGTEPVETEPSASAPSVTEPQATAPSSAMSLEQLRELVNRISGRWYLDGYEDVYLDISYAYNNEVTESNEYMDILSENFSFKDTSVSSIDEGYGYLSDYALYPSQYIDEEKYPNGLSWCAGQTIYFSDWSKELSKAEIRIEDTSIYVSVYKFIREQGTKNQQTEMGGAEDPPITEPPIIEPPVTEPPVTEPPVTEPPVTEPPITEPPITETPSDVLIISDTRTLSNQTIDTDVYITSTGVVTFTNVTVNGNIYCYGKLTVSGGSAHNLYAYYWDLGGITSSCKAWDGTHGLVKGAFKTCESVIIKDDALDYAFDKWGKR